MATLVELRQAVQSLLTTPRFAPLLQLNSNTRDRAFEAYVFALVLEAVRRAGGTVALVGINSGSNPATVVMRGSPGQMSSSTQDFTYAKCELNGKTFEVHVDVQYQGTSGATHEIDVSIFDLDRAAMVRSSGSIPGVRHLYGAFECKFYDSSLGTALGRGFVGLLSDCGTLEVQGFVANGSHEGLAKYFSKKSRPEPFFNLSPLRPAVVSRFVRDVEQAFRKWAGVW